jgi:hypothetical protein
VVEVEGDLRSSAPWTAEIYVRTKRDSAYKYVVTGTIVGPGTILTLLGKAYGAPSRNGGHYKVPFSQDAVVVAGLRSNNFEDRDEFTQVAQVSPQCIPKHYFSGGPTKDDLLSIHRSATFSRTRDTVPITRSTILCSLIYGPH